MFCVQSNQRVHPADSPDHPPVIDSQADHPVLTSGDQSREDSILSRTADSESKLVLSLHHDITKTYYAFF